MSNAPSSPRASRLGRRSFLTQGLLGVAGAGATAYLSSAPQAQAALPAGDVAVLKFLAAAELLETDLWQQYSELATGNRAYRLALVTIDPSLPDYITGDFNDEASHAALINAFLVSRGEQAVNLDAFRTLPGSSATGSSNTLRLTNLSALTVDTSFYTRYRGNYNPDFGDLPPQVVTITRQPTIPVNNAAASTFSNVFALAQTANFHFGMIEQGGASLYGALLNKVSDPASLAILAAIGPTEFWHFSLFMTTLENIRPYRASSSLVFPNLRTDPTRGRITPYPTRFFAASGFPLTSVLRPTSVPKAGAMATATALVNSGLFTGQSNAFLTAVTNLASAADAAARSF